MTPGLFENLVKIEGLPSIGQLHAYALQGRLSLVNAAGVSLHDFHPVHSLSPFELHEYIFSDLFSQRAIVGNQAVIHADPREFTDAFSVQQQDQFRQAAHMLIRQLQRHRSCVVFCHHGVGRSPAVALAALHTLWQIPLPEAARTIRQVRPQAHLSSLSFSAAAWLAGLAIAAIAAVQAG